MAKTIEEKTRDTIFKMSDAFFSMFSSYNSFAVENALGKLPVKEKSIISLLYGLDGVNCLDYDEIADKYNMDIDMVDEIVDNGISKIKKYLDNPKSMEEKSVVKEKDVNKQPKIKNIEEKKLNYREGNNKWLYEYLVNGDEKAYDKLVEKNMKLVYLLAKKYQKEGKNLDDIVSNASMGLLKAIQTFDVNRIGKIAFATYASAVIKNAIFIEYRKEKKHDNLLYFSDPVLDEEEGLTLEDVLASKENFIEDIENIEEYNNKKNKVAWALKTLNEKDRMLVEYLYGFKTGEKHTQEEAAKLLGISQSYASRKTSAILEKLSLLLGEYKLEYGEKEKNKMAMRMSNVFYSMFKGKEKEEVLSVLSNLKYKDLVYLYYGLNNTTCLDYDEIANKYNLATDVVIERINKTITDLEKYLKSEKIKFSKINKRNDYEELVYKYGEETILQLLDEFNKEKKQLFKDYYGIETEALSIKDILYKYGVSNSAIIYQRLNTMKKKIIDSLENPKKHISKKHKFETLFNGYDLKDVYKLIDQLDDKQKDFLKSFYKLSDDCLTKEEYLDKYKEDSIKPYYAPTIIEKLKRKLEKGDKKEKFYQLFESYNKTQVNKALELLKDRDKIFIKEFYGIGIKLLSVEDLSIKYKLTIQGVYSKKYAIIKKIEDILLQNNFNNKKDDNFYSLFNGASKETINDAFAILSKEDQDILTLIYGLKGVKESKQQIATLHNLSINAINYRKVKSIEKMKNYIANPNYESEVKKNEFYSHFEGYNKEKVNEVINKLDADSIKMLSLYYGFESKPITQMEIAKTFNINRSYLSFKINKLIKYIKTTLDNPNLTSIDSRKNKYNELIEQYSKEKVDAEIEKLKDKDKNIIKDYYGLDRAQLSLQEIANKNNVNKAYITNRVIQITKQLVKRLDDPNKRITQFYSRFPEYTKEEIDYAFNTLDDKSKSIIRLVFGLDGESLSYKEIAFRFGVKEHVINNTVFYSVKKIQNILKGEDEKKSKLEKLINKYDNELVQKSIDKLSKTKRGFLVLYYTLLNKKKYALNEISNILGINEDDLLVIEEKVINELEEYLKEEYKIIRISEMKKEFNLQINNKNNLKIIKEILTTEELKLIGIYYGLNGKDIMSEEELSKKLNVDKEKILCAIKNIINKINTYQKGGRK